jgi:hypothetical protein
MIERKYNAAFNHIINYISVPPYLYRYENENYIHDFFEKGDLFISSFVNYRKYEDNELGDTSEGLTMNFGITNNDMQISTLSTVGFNEYSLSTSTILDKKLLEKFKRNSVFRIRDPISFILEVTRSINRVFEVYHGNCIYLDKKIISKEIPDFVINDLKEKEGGISANKLMSMTDLIQGIDGYFIKKREYQEQAEYRIIWKTDRNISDGLVINCPEAREYCEVVNKYEI